MLTSFIILLCCSSLAFAGGGCSKPSTVVTVTTRRTVESDVQRPHVIEIKHGQVLHIQIQAKRVKPEILIPAHDLESEEPGRVPSVSSR